MKRHFIKRPVTAAVLTSKNFTEPTDIAIADEAAELGVETVITYSRSNRGMNVSSGEENIMFYVPEDIYNKDLKEQLSSILKKNGYWSVLERRGRTADGRIKLRQY